LGGPLDKKWQIIDLVRTFSILSVMAAHGTSFLRPFGNPHVEWAVKCFERNGSYGVLIFFVVSGFLITGVIAQAPGGLFKPEFRKFYVRRAGRILPLLALLVSIVSLSLWILPNGSIRVQFCLGFKTNLDDYWFWLSVVTFTFNWLIILKKTGLVYGLFWNILWSLSIEEQFYLFFPATLKKLGKRMNLFLFLITLILFSFFVRLGAYLYGSENASLELISYFGVLDLIALGILLYLGYQRWHSRLSENRKASFLTCVLGFALVLAVYFFTSAQSDFDRVYSCFGLGLGLSGFLLGGMFLPFFDSKYLKPFSLPGKYCYGMYLLHPIVLFFCGSVLTRMNAFEAFTLFTVSTAGLAALSYHLFEMPVNFLIRRKWKG
jgi:peptidoglycan/LPS O-acetylase OafA/YrhL